MLFKMVFSQKIHICGYCLLISLPPFISPVVDMLRPVGPINKCTLCWWQWVVNAVQRPPVLACSTVLCSYNLFCRGNTGQIKENVKGEAWRTEWMLTVLVTVQECVRNAFSLCWKPRFEGIILETKTSYMYVMCGNAIWVHIFGRLSNKETSAAVTRSRRYFN